MKKKNNSYEYSAILNEIQEDRKSDCFRQEDRKSDCFRQEEQNELYKNGVFVINLLNYPLRTKIYDHNKNVLNFKKYEDVLFGGFFIRAILELHSINIIDNKINVFIRTHQIKIKFDDNYNLLSIYSFIQTDSDCDDDHYNNENDCNINENINLQTVSHSIDFDENVNNTFKINKVLMLNEINNGNNENTK